MADINRFYVPTSIDATGATDVTVALLDFIAAVPNGTQADPSVVVFPTEAKLGHPAVYKVEGILQLIDRQGLTIDGNDATFQAFTDGSGYPDPFNKPNWPRNRSHWSVNGGSDIAIRNVNVQSTNTEAVYTSVLEAQHAFAVSGATRVTIENVKARDVWGDFIHLGEEATFVTVRNLDGSGAGRQGIAISDGEDVLVTESSLERVARSGIDLEPNQNRGPGDEIRRVTFRDIDISAVTNFIVASLGTGLVNDDVTFERVRVAGQSFSVKANATPGARRARWSFIDNTQACDGTRLPAPVCPIRAGHPAVQLRSYDGVVITGNTWPFDADPGKTGGLEAVVISDSTDVVIEGNDFGQGTVTVTPPA